MIVKKILLCFTGKKNNFMIREPIKIHRHRWEMKKINV